MAKKKDKKNKKPGKPKAAKASRPAGKRAPARAKKPVAAKARPASRKIAVHKPKAKSGRAEPKGHAAKRAPAKPVSGRSGSGAREPAYERMGSSRPMPPVGPATATVFKLHSKPGEGEASEITIPREARKKMSHIDDATLSKIIAKLDEMRQESQGVVRQHVTNDLEQQKETSDVGDDLDQAVNERDREFDLIMHQRHLRRLQQVQDAFGRLQEGSFGFCEGTEEPINPKRLIIMPLARYSLEFQEQQEKMLGRSPEDHLGNEESFAAEE
jgi:DnaK suppressor protein